MKPRNVKVSGWLGVYSARDALAAALAEMVASNEVTEDKALEIAPGPQLVWSRTIFHPIRVCWNNSENTPEASLPAAAVRFKWKRPVTDA